MKKLLLIITILFSAAYVSRAQSTADTSQHAKLSLGLDFGHAIGSTSNVFSSSFGASFKVELPFANSGLNLTAGAGISSFSPKVNYGDTTQNGHYIPLAIGLKYYVYKIIFIGAEAGDSFNINTNYLDYQSAFYYSGYVGASIPLKDKSSVDISARYESRNESFGNLSQVALRVAYRFDL